MEGQRRHPRRNLQAGSRKEASEAEPSSGRGEEVANLMSQVPLDTRGGNPTLKWLK